MRILGLGAMTEAQTFTRYQAHLAECPACRLGATKGALCQKGYRLHGQWKQAEGRESQQASRGRRVA